MHFARSQADPERSPGLLPAVVALLALHVVLAVGGVIGRSVTSDETAHIAAGVAYWQFNDYRLQPENGNLPQRWGALPFFARGDRLDPGRQTDDWRTSMVWVIAQRFLFESGHDTDYTLFLARCTMLVWSLAAGLLVFFWARAAFGNAGGLGALAFFAVSPTTIAHGPLVTSDMCAAFFLLAATAALWRMCVRPNLRTVLIAGVATGLAFAAKFSAVLLIPVLLVLGIATILARRRSTPAAGGLAFLKLVAASAGAAAIVALVIWSFFGWRFTAAAQGLPPPISFYLPWDRVIGKEGLLPHLVTLARSWQIMPEAYLYGFSFVVYFAAERGAFLAGEYSVTGWWWFFPFAFAVKSTLGELALTALSIWRGSAAIVRIKFLDIGRWLISPLLPLAVFGAVYGIFSLTSHLNIGHRHILPLYLVLFIVGGACLAATAPRWLRGVAAAALLASGLESAANQPNPLAFFNRAAGGPENGWHLLVDSSLDWGQDVAPLARWVRTHRRPDEPVYVSAFGTADPHYEGISCQLLSPYFSLGKPRDWFELKPGLYCVSATMLQDVYGPKPGLWTADLERDFQQLKLAARVNLASGKWRREIPSLGFHPEDPLWLLDRLRFARLCQYLRVRTPDTVINHTQFVFRLNTREIEVVVDRPASELAGLIETAAASRRRSAGSQP